MIIELKMILMFQYMSNRENVSGWREILQSALHELTSLLQEEGLVSSYEIHSSGLIQALLSLVSTSLWDQSSTPTKTNKLQRQRVSVFKNCFKVSNMTTIDKTKITCSLSIFYTNWAWSSETDLIY